MAFGCLQEAAASKNWPGSSLGSKCPLCLWPIRLAPCLCVSRLDWVGGPGRPTLPCGSALCNVTGRGDPTRAPTGERCSLWYWKRKLVLQGPPEAFCAGTDGKMDLEAGFPAQLSEKWSGSGSTNPWTPRRRALEASLTSEVTAVGSHGWGQVAKALPWLVSKHLVHLPGSPGCAHCAATVSHKGGGQRSQRT